MAYMKVTVSIFRRTKPNSIEMCLIYDENHNGCEWIKKWDYKFKWYKGQFKEKGQPKKSVIDLKE